MSSQAEPHFNFQLSTPPRSPAPRTETRYDAEKPLPAMPADFRLQPGREGVRSSWIDLSDSEDSGDVGLDYLRDNLPPSPLSPAQSAYSYGRPRAPTPSTAVSPNPDHSSSPSDFLSSAPALASICSAESPISPVSQSTFHPDPSSLPDQLSPTVPSRSIDHSMALPDPTQFPDPYPFRRPHHHLTSLPALSSAGSSSASTRSSAYTSSGSALASGDYGHVHVASGDDDSNVGVGITSESLVQMLADDPITSSSAPLLQSRIVADQMRWSESYATSSSSRPPSVANKTSFHESSSPFLQQKPSYDMGWQSVDERDEVGLSEEETDDDHILVDDIDGYDDKDEERTSAAVIAEEGRGLIVQADNIPIVQLRVNPGTTHLLIGSSATPNSVPSFLTTTLPQISTTLLALDISANFLGALPPVLAICENLEELNVASNPLRVLPVFLADLTNLQVLIADATGISTLSDALIDLDKLHTISIKRNKMHALPSWLCLLPVLQTLCVDGNPFQGPWKALVEPLLAKAPMTPMYPPSTPMFPLPSASIQGSIADTETDTTDIDDLSDHDIGSPRSNHLFQTPEEEDHTITPDRGPLLGRAATSPYPSNATGLPVTQPRTLARTRTTPNRAYFDQTRAKNATSSADSQAMRVSPSHKQQEDPGYFGDHELRKMKSAGDLRRSKAAAAAATQAGSSTSSPLPNYPTSVSSSNLLNMTPATSERPGIGKRFASLGPSSATTTPSRATNPSRPQLTQSLWDNEPDINTTSPAASSISNDTTSVSQPGQTIKPAHRQRSSRDGKEKGSRWGFLKKMSMGKMKIDSPSPPTSRPQLSRPHTSAGTSAGISTINTPSGTERFSKTPQIDLRFSTTGTLDALPMLATPSTPPQMKRQPSRDLLQVSIPVPPRSSSLLAPPSPLPRSAKRRSFLPVEAPGALTLSIPIPETSSFVPGLTATNEDDAEVRAATPSPAVDSEQYLHREEERARDAYMRALRSVMAYLKDMNDLALSQSVNPLSMYGVAADEVLTRSRRPTIVEAQREVSLALSNTTSISSDISAQLRPSDSILGLRSGTASQTISIATTDSNGSSEERKFKDDKGKRAMVVREIVVTERTYVKGLQELVDIYIKPGTMAVNLLSGVGSSKDTVVPASERRVVFGGIDALFSFHNDSFLPALEAAAAPLMSTLPQSQEIDADGSLSLNVAKAVGNIFLKHAAFMRMYSSYINNFDNSVQRVKYWTTDRHATGTSTPSSATSPTSSTAQLVGLGLTMSSITTPGVVPEGSPATTGIPNLTTGQRKRIKSYLKRCRMNPRHTQLNLEGYLLLPVQRIPRYRLLLEELLRNTPPTHEFMEDPLERALAEISLLANNMNEGKRESESRRRLVQWQTRIRGKFPSPLVQPHRRLIMDGRLLLTRVVRKAMVSFEAINAQGDASTVQVDCLAPELTPRQLIGILCNDLLVLCRDPSDGQDPHSPVDLWAVLRMQTLPQPASIVHGNALRLVDNKAILYFDAPSPSDALNWYRAINLHIPASKT